MKALPFKIFIFSFFVFTFLSPFVFNAIDKKRNSNIYISQSEFHRINSVMDKIITDSSYNTYQISNAKDLYEDISYDGRISLYEAKIFNKNLKQNFIF